MLTTLSNQPLLNVVSCKDEALICRSVPGRLGRRGVSGEPDVRFVAPKELVLRKMSGKKSRRYLRPVATAAVAVFAVGAGATAAFGFGTTVPCSTRSESAVFSSFGDTASYFAMPNGGFESGSTDWSLAGGAGVVSGNESYKVRASTDAHSLRIPAGATVESRTICVTMSEDTIRLFVLNAHVGGAILHVEATVRNPSNGQTAQTAFDVNGDAAPAGWAPTMRLSIPKLLTGSGTQELTLRVSTRGTPATWSIDDVYVDPFKSY